MLWQKELIKGELVYAKLMDKNERKIFLAEFSAKMKEFASRHNLLKKDKRATEAFRGYGNLMFASGRYEEAIGMYNKALTVAVNNSEDLGLCYANRAASFLKLNQYKLCLVDIELAKKNKYPAASMSKLERRRIECENQLAANGDVDLQQEEPKLSFEPDQKIPCFASGLKVEVSDKYGSCIITQRNLDIGQTVIAERTMFSAASKDNCDFCENCFKRKANLMPCKKCVIAMFCSEECRKVANEKFHDVLCMAENFCGEPMQQMLLQSIVIAVKTFSTVSALMAAVEKFRAQDANDINFDDPAKRDYFTFFQLHTNADKLSAEQKSKMKNDSMEVVEIIKTRSSFESIFRSTKTTQFLSHLALHHMKNFLSNTYAASHIVSSAFESVLGIQKAESLNVFGFGLTLYSSHMNHSCTPNICRIFVNDMVVYKVLRPIKSGEQLFFSYL